MVKPRSDHHPRTYPTPLPSHQGGDGPGVPSHIVKECRVRTLRLGDSTPPTFRRIGVNYFPSMNGGLVPCEVNVKVKVSRIV